MGQYHYVANLDKREFLHPHKMGDGLKLLEFGASGSGTMLGLALLLAVSNKDDSTSGPFQGQRGGGDFHVWNDPYGDGRDVGDVTPRDHDLARTIVGRWGGDRIAIIGDYAEDQDVGPDWRASDPEQNPMVDEDGKFWTDISLAVRRVMSLDYYNRQEISERWDRPGENEEDPYAILNQVAT